MIRFLTAAVLGLALLGAPPARAGYRDGMEKGWKKGTCYFSGPDL